jgi:hypothetical protein
MTSPCSTSDLPTPFEHVVNFDGSPVFAYLYPAEKFSDFEETACRNLNPKEILEVSTEGGLGYVKDPSRQIYFYGELVPPYIDVLGRGAHLRTSTKESLRYATKPRCYYNAQRFGSTVYQRMRDFHGPQYDIQTGFNHQGYGEATYHGMFGKGSKAIPLPVGRRYDAAYNCTPGFQLHNESKNPSSTTKVYTEAEFDPAGVQRVIPLGEDGFYPGTCEADVICNSEFIAEAEPCAEGHICDESTTLAKSIDYKCRAGFVCDFGTTPDWDIEAPFSQFKVLCPEGYYCPAGTGHGQRNTRPCPEGYFCPAGTAMPDLGLVASDAIVRNLTAEEADPYYDMTHLVHISNDDIRVLSAHDARCIYGGDIELGFRYRTRWENGAQASNNPTIAFLNVFREDSLNGDHPFRPVTELADDGHTRVPVACNASLNYTAENVYAELGLSLDDIDEESFKQRCKARPSVIQRATEHNLKCGRDNKWRLVQDAVDRRECDCLTQTIVTLAVYRLWKCKATGTDLSSEYWYNSSGALDDLGLGTVDPMSHDYSNVVVKDGEAPIADDVNLGGRDYWFYRGHLPPKNASIVGTEDDPTCSYPDAIQHWYLVYNTTDEYETQYLFNSTHGELDSSTYLAAWSRQASNGAPIVNSADTLELYDGVEFRVTWDPNKDATQDFETYAQLKSFVELEITQQRLRPTETHLDPYIYDLWRAIRLVEEYGTALPDFVDIEWKKHIDPDTGEHKMKPYPKRMDACDCERLLKCPNGTRIDPASGATQILDCVTTREEVLMRSNAVPIDATKYSWWRTRYDERKEEDKDTGILSGTDMFLRNMSDFVHLSGTNDMPVGSLFLRTFESVVLTLDLRDLAVNLTYDDHYRIAVYVDCKPCPVQYACNYEQEPPTCNSPSLEDQLINYERCLEIENTRVCMNATGVEMDCDLFDAGDPCIVEYWEGDLAKCNQIPYYCDDTPRYTKNWRIPMEYCIRDSEHKCIAGNTYYDSLNNFKAGKTAVDMDILGGGTTTKTVLRDYIGWIEPYADYDYACNASGSNMRKVVSAFLNSSGFENSLKPFNEDPVGYDDELQYEKTITGCCKCEPHSMPEFFNQKMKDPGFPDNKHTDVQLVVSALKDTEITICFELQHGQYVAEFEAGVKGVAGPGGTGELFMHVPYRADYTNKNKRKRNSFLALIKSETADEVMLPMNLPRKFVRNAQSLPSTDYTTGYSARFEYDIVIDRPARWDTSDPCNALLTDGGGSVSGVPRSVVCNFPARQEKRDRAVAEINTDVAAVDADDGQGGNLAYMVSEPVEVATAPLGWWRNPPNTGEDTATQNPFESFPTQWAEGKKNTYEYTVNGDVADSDIMSENENTFLYMPWLPYFSNCDGYDSHMNFMRLIETHPDCIVSQSTYANTQYVVQMPLSQDFTFAAPVSDECVHPAPSPVPPYRDPVTQYAQGIEIQCTYEENAESVGNAPRWFELGSEAVPFYLTKYPIPPSDFETDWRTKRTPTTDPRWGRSYRLRQQKDGERVLPVVVDPIFFSDIGVLPRRVKLYIEYFQEGPGNKRLVKAALQFFDLCYTRAADPVQINILEKPGQFEDKPDGIRPCSYTWDGHLNDTQYTLEFTLKPAQWVDLLNYFELRGEVYMAFYTVIGLVAILQGVAIWVVHRLLTKLRYPPPFHAQTMLTIISEAPMIGVALAVIPIALICFIVFLWFKNFANFGAFASITPETTPSAIKLEGVDGNWMDSMGLSAEQIFTYGYGRTGVCFVAIGLYLNFLCSSLIVPNWNQDEEDEEEANPKKKKAVFDDDEDRPPPSDTWAPVLWKRAHLILANILVQFLMLWVWEFSYGQWFEDNVYSFVILFKCVQICMDIVFKAVMREHLMSNPLIMLLGMTEIMVTMGASTFTEFVLSYFVDLSIVCLERLYLDPLVKTCYKLLPRWKMQFNRRFGNRVKMTREEKAKEQMEWRRVNEAIEHEAEGIEPLMDSYSVFSTELAAMLCTPILNLFLMVFREETRIPSLYGIRETDLVFYAFFNFYIIIFSFIDDVFLLNAQELVHGWKVFDFVSYQRYRFSVREHRWVMDARVVDESIAPGMQMLDVLCFSEQYFFLISLYGLGGMISMFGISIFYRHNYNLFGDPVVVLILMTMFVIGDLLQHLFIYLSNIKIRRLGWRGLWTTKHIEGTVDDDVAAKLAIGEGRQADLEQERLELQALNSERFRHRFLDRNRPWILQHLVELLTPESLNEIGPDGRPVVEYIRDVYADLLSMGEGARRKGDREDISSDEEENSGPGTEWSNMPLKGTNLLIARLWLDKARKRRGFHKLIAGVIKSNEANECAVCGRTKAAGAVMTVQLATDGYADDSALDRLIAGFEDHYGPKETDANLWRAYFRANAEFITRCERCVNELEQRKLKREGPPQVGGRTRAVDLSSDEEDEEVMFDPVVVVREAPEGKMLSKWLDAARRRCGGTFPRPEARKQMEEYAEKMRARKLKKAHDRRHARPGLDSDSDDDGNAQAAKWAVNVSAAGRALAQRWLRKAQDSMVAAFKGKGTNLRNELTETLKVMAPEDDWYFGADLRIEGAALNEAGDQLSQDQRTIEAEEAVKVRRVEQDYESFEATTRAAMEEKRREFEANMARESERQRDLIEIRIRELERNKEETRKEFDAEEKQIKEEDGAVPQQMADDHRARLDEMDGIIRVTAQRMEREKNEKERASRSEFDNDEAIQEQLIISKRVSASSQVRQIRKAALLKMKSGESAWQVDAAQWLFAAKRKIEMKAREDAEEAAKNKKKKRK